MNRLVLLADFDVVKNMGNRFHGKQAQLDSSDLMMALVIVGVVILIAVILTRLTRRQDRQPHFSNPRSLFKELCQAHGLDGSERRLLRRLAVSQGLDQPSRLFLEAERWNPLDLPSNLVQYAGRLQDLHGKLFAMAVATDDDALVEETATIAAPALVESKMAAPLNVVLPDLLSPPGFGSELPALDR